MAHSFISYYKSNGLEYAAVCTPARKDKIKVNNPVYLGRVINKEEGRFRSRARGEFLYSVENGFSTLTPDPAAAVEAAIAKGSLNLGHVYCTHTLLERTGLLNLILDTVGERDKDTLPALIMHRLLDCYADSHANAFFEQTYASLLYPSADLTSQGISRFLARIGSEATRRDFHRRYISMVYPDRDAIGILIDSTGLENDIDIYLTAVSNHGGEAKKEIRLIYVVDRETMSPIYYRAIPGNVVDISTLKGTIDELKTMGVNIDCSVLDAGYNSESNLEELFSLGINFMTRLISNRTLYKTLLASNCHKVIRAENREYYNKRLIFMVKNKVTLPNNRTAYAYVGVDWAKKSDVVSRLGANDDEKKRMSDADFQNESDTAGMFVMISSVDMPNKEVLPYYYSRQTIEQIFDTSKNYTKLLPLGVHSVETFNGHLLVSFITTIIYLNFTQIFKNTKFNTIDFITIMRGVTCGVYEDHLHIYELTAKQKAILKILNMEIPPRLPLTK